MNPTSLPVESDLLRPAAAERAEALFAARIAIVGTDSSKAINPEDLRGLADWIIGPEETVAEFSLDIEEDVEPLSVSRGPFGGPAAPAGNRYPTPEDDEADAEEEEQANSLWNFFRDMPVIPIGRGGLQYPKPAEPNAFQKMVDEMRDSVAEAISQIDTSRLVIPPAEVKFGPNASAALKDAVANGRGFSLFGSGLDFDAREASSDSVTAEDCAEGCRCRRVVDGGAK